MDRSETDMKLLLEKGKTQMIDELYPDALGSIMKAVNLCPCKPISHGRDKSCNISQCISAVRKSDSDPDVFYRVASGPCSCGFRWPVCSRPLHLEAVDTLAACLEKAQRFSAAFSTALGLIRLNPSSGIGYCRVAKMIRYLVKNHEGSDQVLRSISALLRDAKLADIKKLRDSLPLFVKCALYKTDKSDNYHTVLRQMSHILKLPESRRDPFTKLPRELIGMIFSHLNTTSLIRCCRVNKSWRQTIEADRILWSSITMKKPKTSRYFAKFLQRHQTVRKLSIHDISRLLLDVPKLATILRLPRLQQLCITGDGSLASYTGNHIKDLKSNEIAPLERLSVLLRSNQRNFSTWGEIIFNTAATLQVLELGAGAAWRLHSFTHPRFVMPNLKKLYLNQSTEDGRPLDEGWIELRGIANCSPNLEHLYLEGCKIFLTEDVPNFKSLQSVSIGSGCISYPQFTGYPPQYLPSTMRVIELISADRRICDMLLFRGHSINLHPFNNADTNDPDNPLLQFPNLEVLKCKCPLTAGQFKQLAEPGLQNGTLKVLELAMDHFDSTSRVKDPAKDYPLAASELVHTVGLYDFKWEYANELTAGPFVEWLDRFPNTTTVAAYPVPTYDGVLSLFRRLICHPGIKVVHQDSLRGVEWDIAQELAKEKGVQLLHTPKHTPIGWPVATQ
ncbi:hypothetical protein QBC37DRAFT_151475 [Rhypophila decipiens]|uniref:F-box domain-containing protein n=1 Tax=Rhypophila decipiens TaxID=261697 RepID=A0AAN7BCQ1_9PEZI|nr:hypothetical protein QBC37DRAFT_151475 [Rhypophila decipiens]